MFYAYGVRESSRVVSGVGSVSCCRLMGLVVTVRVGASGRRGMGTSTWTLSCYASFVARKRHLKTQVGYQPYTYTSLAIARQQQKVLTKLMHGV